MGMSFRVLALAALGGVAFVFPTISDAADGSRIQIDGVKSIAVPTRSVTALSGTPLRATTSRAQPVVAVGDAMPKKFTMLLNTARLGLPKPRDGWVYFKAYRDIYRVDLRSREVLERVTHLANGAF